MAVTWTRTVIPDPSPVELDPGHPWAGRVLRPVWIRWEDERGRVRWTWRPHVEER